MSKEYHGIRALTMMVKLALFEKRYYEASVLMHERSARLSRWNSDMSSIDTNLLHLTILDTQELEKNIADHILQVSAHMEMFTESIQARRAYILTQMMTSSNTTVSFK